MPGVHIFWELTFLRGEIFSRVENGFQSLKGYFERCAESFAKLFFLKAPKLTCKLCAFDNFREMMVYYFSHFLALVRSILAMN